MKTPKLIIKVFLPVLTMACLKLDAPRTVFADQPGVSLEKSFDRLDLYKIPDESFLPRFYIPQNIFFLNGTLNNLTEVISFENWGNRSAAFINDYSGAGIESLPWVDEIIVSSQCLRCDFSRLAGVTLPPPEYLPDFVFYPLVTWKENAWEKKILKLGDPVQELSLNLGLAGKRLAEIKKMKEEEEIQSAVETTKKYIERMRKTKSVIERIEKENRQTNDLYLWAGDFLQSHREYLKVLLKMGLPSEAEGLLKGVLWEVDDLLFETKSKQWKSELEVRRYVFDVPRESEYEILIKNENTGDYYVDNPFDPIIFDLDGKEASGQAELRNDGWFLIDKFTLGEGQHRLSLRMPEARNLVETESFFLEPGSGKRATAVLPISRLDNDGLYKITFDYQDLKEESVRFMIVQDTDEFDGDSGRIKHDIEEYLECKTFPQTFEFYWEPNVKATKAELKFIFDAGEQNVFKAQNIRVERSWSPDPFLRSTAGPERKRLVPQITFKKINSTKYQVEVKNAKDPFILIFSESFHQGWKAYVRQQSESSLQGRKVNDQPGNPKPVVSYFGGDIREKEAENSLWNSQIFSTLNKKAIPEERHWPVNGYANSWYVTPDDFGGSNNFELIVEFWPQRLFYLGGAISALAFLIYLAYLIWFIGKKSK